MLDRRNTGCPQQPVLAGAPVNGNCIFLMPEHLLDDFQELVDTSFWTIPRTSTVDERKNPKNMLKRRDVVR